MGEHNFNNWFFIGRWSVANMLSYYYNFVGHCWQLETSNGPIKASHIMPTPRLPMENFYWADIGLHAVWASLIEATFMKRKSCIVIVTFKLWKWHQYQFENTTHNMCKQIINLSIIMIIQSSGFSLNFSVHFTKWTRIRRICYVAFIVKNFVFSSRLYRLLSKQLSRFHCDARKHDDTNVHRYMPRASSWNTLCCVEGRK